MRFYEEKKRSVSKGFEMIKFKVKMMAVSFIIHSRRLKFCLSGGCGCDNRKIERNERASRDIKAIEKILRQALRLIEFDFLLSRLSI